MTLTALLCIKSYNWQSDEVCMPFCRRYHEVRCHRCWHRQCSQGGRLPIAVTLISSSILQTHVAAHSEFEISFLLFFPKVLYMGHPIGAGIPISSGLPMMGLCCSITMQDISAVSGMQVGVQVPLIVRLEGTNVEKGKEILSKSDVTIITADDLDDAATKAVKSIQ